MSEEEYLKHIEKEVREWGRTKSTSLAYDICSELLKRIKEKDGED